MGHFVFTIDLFCRIEVILSIQQRFQLLFFSLRKVYLLTFKTMFNYYYLENNNNTYKTNYN